MHDLIKKYHAGTLTPSDLRNLRDLIAGMSDEELAQALLGSPVVGRDITPESIDIDAVERMKLMIDSAIDDNAPRRFDWRRWLTVAAAVITPLLFCSTIFLYLQSDRDSRFPDYTLITTARGQHTTVTLPDGTVATLNGESSIEFPSRFAEGMRTVKFAGEAYFDVAKADGLPFDIVTEGMTVEVKGTSFNLLARNNMPTSAVTLESGLVRLVATPSHHTVNITPGHTAILDKADGRFRIDSVGISGQPDWTRREMRLRGVTPDSLVRRIESAYDIALDPAIVAAINDRFTGTLPTDDLFGAIDILGAVYGFNLPYHTTRPYTAATK